MMAPPSATLHDRPRVGISRCLLGDRVRYDGGHKRDSFLISTFGAHVEWVPVCPEVEVGMGTPREAIHLIALDERSTAAGRIRLVGVRSGTDWTARMQDWSKRRVTSLAGLDLSGYILKKDSPSCGLEQVRIHRKDAVERTGRGMFAAVLLEAMPDLPVEEEGRLTDPRQRDNFVERVFAYQRLSRLFSSRWTIGSLVSFHAAHKLQLLSHSRSRYTELGHLVAGASGTRRELHTAYRRAFMSALRTFATPGRHANVLMHMLGHLRGHVDDASRRELLEVIQEYRRGVIPLIAPLVLFRHHVMRHDVEYLKGQVYLDLHPHELSLRNHA